MCVELATHLSNEVPLVSTSMSGFLELLPEQELVQQHLLGLVRRQFELHGFGPLQTRSIERVEDLVNQGDTEKEIYAVQRLAATEVETDSRLALHYDLTVPFARFVREHQGDLVFPFRRYQIQPAWRGERPQLGRYREFVQADADIIGKDELDVSNDADMVAMLSETLNVLPIPSVRLLVNNRKLLEGLYLGLGIEQRVEVLRTVDKLQKIQEKGVRAQLAQLGLTEAQVDGCLAVSRIEAKTATELRGAIAALGVSHPVLDQGVSELCLVLERCQLGADTTGETHAARATEVVAALHIARGFDYYTGTVVEGVLRDYPGLGAVCSGGRYDNLASTKQPLPGMGVSIGITRLVSFLLHLDLLKPKRKSPAQVLVLLHGPEQRALSLDVAQKLRLRGIPCLVSHSAKAYGKQIQQASRLGIDYVWFPAQADQGHSVKDIVSGEQQPADLATWLPDLSRSNPGDAIALSKHPE